MTTYEVSSRACTRSKPRRDRSWLIEADTPADACYEARERHLKVVGWNAAIIIRSVEDVGQSDVLR